MKKNLRWQVLPYSHADNGKALIDYEHYQFGRKEMILYGLEAIGMVLFFAYFFYRSYWAVIPLVSVGIFFLKRKRMELGKKQQDILKIQFKEAVLSISAGMRAGYSAENALKEAYKDMVRMFGRQSLICRELAYILGGMSNNIPVEKLLQNFGNRSGVEEIKEFSNTFYLSTVPYLKVMSGKDLPIDLMETYEGELCRWNSNVKENIQKEICNQLLVAYGIN